MPIHRLMEAWVDIENQRTPYNVIAMEPDQLQEVKNNHYLRAFETIHTAPSLGYVLIENAASSRSSTSGFRRKNWLNLKKEARTSPQTLMIPPHLLHRRHTW
ncbi:MAG: hypothetical protein HC892_20680, partial [Saprospiraceae bacterium]|nr:hypothetical protein [Saprospiraceae bacterium]